MSRRGRLGAVIAAAATITLAAGLEAQPAPGTVGAAAGASFEAYEFLEPEAVGLEHLTLIVLPIASRVQVLDRLWFHVGSAFARGSLRRVDGSEAVLSGPTDTELRASYTAGRDRLVVSAALLLPTGQSSHTLDEAEVAGTIAADLVPMRISQWGSGGGLNVSVAAAVPAGVFGVGAAVGYTRGRTFDALELTDETWAYRPGDELVLRIGVDRRVRRTGKAAAIFGLRRYADDELQGQTLLRPGTRMEATGMYSFAAGATGTGVAYLGIAHRGAGVFALHDTELPPQNLVLAGAGFRVPLGAATLVPSGELRLVRSADGLNQGHLAGLGAALELPVGGATLVPVLRSRVGRVLLWEGEESSFRGGELGVTLRIGGSS